MGKEFFNYIFWLIRDLFVCGKDVCNINQMTGKCIKIKATEQSAHSTSHSAPPRLPLAIWALVRGGSFYWKDLHFHRAHSFPPSPFGPPFCFLLKEEKSVARSEIFYHCYERVNQFCPCGTPISMENSDFFLFFSFLFLFFSFFLREKNNKIQKRRFFFTRGKHSVNHCKASQNHGKA